MSSRYYVDGAATEEFAKWMYALADLIPSAKLTEGQIRAYAQVLGDIEPQALRTAFGRASRENDGFYPSAAQLRKLAGEPTSTDAALLAWSGLCRAAEEVGAYATLSCEDGCAVEALLSVFGSWQAFCEMPDGPALTQHRQQFLAYYRTWALAARKPRTHLPGICESSGRAPDFREALTWMAKLRADGTILYGRDIVALEAGRERPALPEGRDAQDGKGAKET